MRYALITRSLLFFLVLPVLAFLLLIGCAPDRHKARKALASTDPRARQEGASALSKIYAKDPKALGDPGEQYWVDRLKGLPGASEEKSRDILGGATSMGGEGSGGAETDNMQLDEFWAATVYRNTRKFGIIGYRPPRRRVVHIDVERPPSFTDGTWTTYFVNGAVFNETTYQNGVIQRDREYHDSGKLRREYRYVDGKLDGTFTYLFANGNVEWEQTYAKGKQVGHWKWFHPNGKVQQEEHYADDKLEGRMTNYTQEGVRTYCTDYHAGVQVDAGCWDDHSR